MVLEKLNIKAKPIQIGFYYKRTAITITEEILRENSTHTMESWIDFLEKAVYDYKKGIEKHGTDYIFRQLDQIFEDVKKQEGFNLEQMLIWCTNIFCATQLGYLKNDDDNGLLIMNETEFGDMTIEK
jgi:hypothetical protein